MKEKLQLLMERLQLKPGQFARMLDVNPAIISHILAERNKPGVDLLQRILSNFPQVNPDWLLLDSGEMFRNPQSSKNTTAPERSTSEQSEQTLFASNFAANAQTGTQSGTHPNLVDRSNGIERADVAQLATKSNSTTPNKAVTHVVLFYADGTFDSFIPTNDKNK